MLNLLVLSPLSLAMAPRAPAELSTRARAHLIPEQDLYTTTDLRIAHAHRCESPLRDPSPSSVITSWPTSSSPAKPPWPAQAMSARASRLLSPAHRLSVMSPQGITVFGAGINILLSALKLSVGGVAGSASLVADGVHSFSDLVSDALCWVAVQVPSFEHAFTLGIAAVLFSTGVGMAAIALPALFAASAASAATTSLVGAIPALSVALASVASKELLFWLTHAVGTRHRSPSILANAYHHRSDALSSLVAVAGIVGTAVGWARIDSLAASVVGLMVAGMGFEVGRDSLRLKLAR